MLVWLKPPSLRFRAKVTLGFAAVLGISAVSMGLAYIGFERVSEGVVAYRTSVAESGLSRNIDRELISYQALTRYYVVTGREDDAKSALAAEARLRDAIEQSMKVTTSSARLTEITRLAREFKMFTKIFAEIVDVKNANDKIASVQMSRMNLLLRTNQSHTQRGVSQSALIPRKLWFLRVTRGRKFWEFWGQKGRFCSALCVSLGGS